MVKKLFCDRCVGLCCRYFALPIETPEDKEDYDDIRWYLCHEDITVFVEDGDWYINIKNKCRYLTDDYKCAIYNKKPKICRTYSTKDCDFVEGQYDYEMHFTSDKQMEEYIKIKFGSNKTRRLKPKSKKTRQKTGRKRKKE